MNNVLTELQLIHQQQLKEKRDSVKQRKARTHRLIVRGAMAENAIPNAERMTDEQFQEALLHALQRTSAVATSHPQDSHGSVPRKSPSEDPAEHPSEDTCGSNPR